MNLFIILQVLLFALQASAIWWAPMRCGLQSLCDREWVHRLAAAWSDGVSCRATLLLLLAWRGGVLAALGFDGLHVVLAVLVAWPSMASGVVLPSWVLLPATLWCGVAGTGGAHAVLLAAATVLHVAYAAALRVPRPCAAFRELGRDAALAGLALRRGVGAVADADAAVDAATAGGPPPPRAALLLASARALARALRRGAVTSVSLVELFGEQAQRVHADTNAMAAQRQAEALREAAAADARLAAGAARTRGPAAASPAPAATAPAPAAPASAATLPPFLGVPMMSKECMELPGQPYTAGLVQRARDGVVGRETMPTLQRLRDAGFIVLGAGNVSEGCMWMESYNGVYGRSANPCDTRRTPGGSSGGTAALVAAGAAPVAITSDVGGSTRIPAFFTGVFGHKPTGGALDVTTLVAQFRQAFDIWSAMLSGGSGHLAFRHIIAEGKAPVWVAWELLKLLLGVSDHTLPALALAAVERVPEALPAPSEALRARGRRLRAALCDTLGDGVMLYPTLPRPAPLHNESLACFLDSGATSIFNVLELPATAVPLGESAEGLPLGVQVVGNHGADYKTIGVAIALERAEVAGWVLPRSVCGGTDTENSVKSVNNMKLKLKQ
eukprot:g5660.t1